MSEVGRDRNSKRPKTGGRAAGTPNKATRAFRETVNALLEQNSENVAIWLEQVATGSHGKEPAPEKALDLLAKLAEYAAPKLARTEIVGDRENPLQVQALDASKLSTDVLAQIVAAKDAADKG